MSLEGLTFNWVFFWSFISLLAERLWRSFWPALSVLFTFLGLACLKFFDMFSNAGHAALLLLFVAAFVAAGRFGTRFTLPRTGDVRRAIEKESDLRHRPLEAMKDTPVKGQSVETMQLWNRYQERLRKLGIRLKISRPRPNVGARDPYYIRFATLALLFIGLGVARHEAPFRIHQALTPDVKSWFTLGPVALDAWITPPDYTHQNPVFLATTQLGATPEKGAITVPENSILKVRLAGYSRPPKLVYDGVEHAFTQSQPKNFTLEMPITKSGELKITQWYFRQLGNWPVTVTNDLAPGIVVLKTETTKRSKLKITYMAKDDYRIKSVSGTIAPTPELLKVFGTKTVDFDVPVPDSPDKEMDYTTDLTSHPWAGSPVLLTLTASDDAGHESVSEVKQIVLPERAFTNPVAQRIIAARKKLIWYSDKVTQKLVITELADIASHPDNYKWDRITFLGLDVAVKRLVYDGKTEAVASLIPFLWDLAVRVEDGGVSLAGRELSDALQKLSDGLKDKTTSKEQLQQLRDNVNQKMREYVKNLANEMQQRMMEGKNQPQMSPELANKIMQQVDMQKLMDQLQAMDQGSEREQMERMAEYMKNSIDNMDMRKMDQMQKGQKESMQALEDLQKLIQRQQQLNDKTNKLQPKDQQLPDENAQKPEDKKPEEKKPDEKKQDEKKSDDKKPDENKQHDKKNDQKKDDKQSGEQKDDKKDSGDQGGQKQEQQQQGGDKGDQGDKGQQQGQQQDQQPQPGSDDGKQGDQQGQKQQGQQAGGQQGNSGQQQVPNGQQSGQSQGQQPGQTPGGQQGDSQQGQGSGMSQGRPQLQPGQGSGKGQQNMPVPIPGESGNQPPQNAMKIPGGNGGMPDPTPNDAQAQQQSLHKNNDYGQNPQKQQAQGGDGKPEPAMPPIRSPKDSAAEQGGIRDKLGDIMRKMGEGMPQLPDNFAKSDQAMKGAVNNLNGNDLKNAVPMQREALDQLQQGMDKSVKAMADSLSATMLNFGFMPEGADKGFGEGYDPLGRGQGKPNGRGKPGSDYVKIPDEKERRRVQEIIEELRSRSNDFSRPKEEREYIDRLLDQFN